MEAVAVVAEAVQPAKKPHEKSASAIEKAAERAAAKEAKEADRAAAKAEKEAEKAAAKAEKEAARAAANVVVAAPSNRRKRKVTQANYNEVDSDDGGEFDPAPARK
eukprot:4164285-Prymnesium_polylepis.1